MLMRFDPFAAFSHAGGAAFGRPFDRLASELRSLARSALPLDAYRQGDTWVAVLDLPGVDPASIDLTVDRNVLTVTAERTWRPHEGQEVLVAERPQGRFTRQLFLGEGLDTERVDAAYEHGVLTVRIPVAERSKPRKVQITAGGGHARQQALEASATEAA